MRERDLPGRSRPRCRRPSWPCCGAGTGLPAASETGPGGGRRGLHADHPYVRARSRAAPRRSRRPTPRHRSAPPRCRRRAPARGSRARPSPCPARTSMWSNGCTSVAPVRSAPGEEERVVDRETFEVHARPRTPWSPRPSACGAAAGMNTVCRDAEHRSPTSATPCAWLPALAATTPRARSSALRAGDPVVGAARA